VKPPDLPSSARDTADCSKNVPLLTVSSALCCVEAGQPAPLDRLGMAHEDGPVGADCRCWQRVWEEIRGLVAVRSLLLLSRKLGTWYLVWGLKRSGPSLQPKTVSSPPVGPPS
jgi:hypothetical protein